MALLANARGVLGKVANVASGKALTLVQEWQRRGTACAAGVGSIQARFTRRIVTILPIALALTCIAIVERMPTALTQARAFKAVAVATACDKIACILLRNRDLYVGGIRSIPREATAAERSTNDAKPVDTNTKQRGDVSH